VGNLFAVGLDNAGSDVEYDRQYGAYEFEQLRLDAFADWFRLGTDYVEHIRWNFRVAFGGNLQPFNQELKRQL
jgi:hypothetical protein